MRGSRAPGVRLDGDTLVVELNLTAVLLCVVLVAFAANSLLCRFALEHGVIDPVSFTAVRIASGATFLLLLMAARRDLQRPTLNFVAVLALYGYALLFSLAYVELGAATGALLLFSAVQFTMIGLAVSRGEMPSRWAWMGFGTALAGLYWLLFPKVTAPPRLAAGQMLLAGIAWGLYSTVGVRGVAALRATTWNFLFATPLAVLLWLVHPADAHFEPAGVWSALLSGAVASGAGYALWYHVLPRLRPIVAASSQLTVPVIATLGSVLLLGEPFTAHLALGGIAILGGVAVIVVDTQRRARTAAGFETPPLDYVI